MDFHNVNWCVCVCVIVQKKYFPLLFLGAYIQDGLRANVHKDNIVMGIKGIALMATRTEINLIYNLKSTIISHEIW